MLKLRVTSERQPRRRTASRPTDHGRGEDELHPAEASPFTHSACPARDQMRHGEDEHRQRQRGADPEPPRHVAQFGVVLGIRRVSLRFQRHPAFGARAGMVLLNFRVHRAGVDGFAVRLVFALCGSGR